mmetsp:Transcript_10426/g.28822  ORF Transcript_10426/g.28822 Transcript_10426/m.28822 type:complete len:543 (-) Transcript_10426:138-1766(-)
MMTTMAVRMATPLVDHAHDDGGSKAISSIKTSTTAASSTASTNNNNKLDGVPTLDAKDIEINRLLGTGAFSAVFSFHLKRKVLQQLYETHEPQPLESATANSTNSKAAPQKEGSKKRGSFLSLLQRTIGSSNGGGGNNNNTKLQEDHSLRTKTKTSMEITGTELEEHHHNHNHSSNKTTMGPESSVAQQQELEHELASSLDPDQYEWLALKRLSHQSKHCPKQMVVAQRELYKEARTLASLATLAGDAHPHIVRFYGLSSDFLPPLDNNHNNSSLRQCSETAFIVLERLTESLDQRLQRWKREEKEANKVAMIQWKQLFSKKKKSKTSEEDKNCPTTTPDNQRLLLQTRRIQQVALGLSSALAFLHDEAHMVYRDLKPCNVGFAADGTVRLFDFSTARKLPTGKKKLPGFVGTPRYMAPENALGLEYGYSADVYSFGLVLWELLSLEKPYRESMTAKQVLDMQESGFAHSTECIASTTIQQLLWAKEEEKTTTTTTQEHQLHCGSCCWNRDPKSRPTMKRIHEILSQEVAQVLGDEQHSHPQ